MIGKEMFLRLVESAQKNYAHGYYKSAGEAEIDGVKHLVELHRVGHNASHSFSIGLLPDGRMIVQSIGEGDEADEFGVFNSVKHTSVCGTAEEARQPYLGHW